MVYARWSGQGFEAAVATAISSISADFHEILKIAAKRGINHSHLTVRS